MMMRCEGWTDGGRDAPPLSHQFMSDRMHTAAKCQYAVHEYLKAALAAAFGLN